MGIQSQEKTEKKRRSITKLLHSPYLISLKIAIHTNAPTSVMIIAYPNLSCPTDQRRWKHCRRTPYLHACFAHCQTCSTEYPGSSHRCIATFHRSGTPTEPNHRCRKNSSFSSHLRATTPLVRRIGSLCRIALFGLRLLAEPEVELRRLDQRSPGIRYKVLSLKEVEQGRE